MAVPSHDDILQAILGLLVEPSEGWKAPMMFRPAFGHHDLPAAVLRPTEDTGSVEDMLSVIVSGTSPSTLTFGQFREDGKFIDNVSSNSMGNNLVNKMTEVEAVRSNFQEYRQYVDATPGRPNTIKRGSEVVRLQISLESRIDSTEWGIRSQVQREIKANDFSPENSYPQFVREYTFTASKKSSLLANLTLIVKNISDTKQHRSFYTVDLRREGGTTPPRMREAIMVILQFMQAASTVELVVSNSERRKVAANFNVIFGREAYRVPIGQFYSQYIPRPAHLMMEQLLLGSPTRSDGVRSEKKSSPWTIMFKYDGLRKQLISTKDGSYLVTPPGDATKISSTSLSSTTPAFVFDGEWLDATNTFYPFDCPSIDNKDVRLDAFAGRIEDVKRLVADVKGSVEVKMPELFGGEVTQASIQAFAYQESHEGLKDICDGLIFVPPGGYSGRRYKWKPTSKLTIDFVVGPNRSALVAHPDGTNVIFKGSDSYPVEDGFKISKTFSSGGTPEDVVEGRVVECLWEDDEFRPYRVRHDRYKANPLDTAQQLWTEINEPVTERDLRGDDFGILRRAVELKMLESLSTFTVPDKTNVLVVGHASNRFLNELRNMTFIPQHVDEVMSVNKDKAYGAILIMDARTFGSFGNKTSKIKEALEHMKNLLVAGGRVFGMFLNFDVTADRLQNDPTMPVEFRVDEVETTVRVKGKMKKVVKETNVVDYAKKPEIPYIDFGNVRVKQRTKFVEEGKAPVGMSVDIFNSVDGDDKAERVMMVSAEYLKEILEDEGMAPTMLSSLKEAILSSRMSDVTFAFARDGLYEVSLPTMQADFAELHSLIIVSPK